MKLIKKFIFKLRYKLKKFYSIKVIPILLSTAKLFKKIGINRLIEIRISKTIFFYLALVSFCIPYFIMCACFINDACNINYPFFISCYLIFIISSFMFLVLEIMEYGDNKKIKRKKKKSENKNTLNGPKI